MLGSELVVQSGGAVKRPLLLLVGVAVGVVLSGIAAGILIPSMPADWRSAGFVWGSSALLVGVCVAIALVLSRPRRE